MLVAIGYKLTGFRVPGIFDFGDARFGREIYQVQVQRAVEELVTSCTASGRLKFRGPDYKPFGLSRPLCRERSVDDDENLEDDKMPAIDACYQQHHDMPEDPEMLASFIEGHFGAQAHQPATTSQPSGGYGDFQVTALIDRVQSSLDQITTVKEAAIISETARFRDLLFGSLINSNG